MNLRADISSVSVPGSGYKLFGRSQHENKDFLFLHLPLQIASLFISVYLYEYSHKMHDAG